MTPILCSCRRCLDGQFINCQKHPSTLVKEINIKVTANVLNNNVDNTGSDVQDVENDLSGDRGHDVKKIEKNQLPETIEEEQDVNTFVYNVAGERSDIIVTDDQISSLNRIPQLDILIGNEIMNKPLRASLHYPLTRNEFFDTCDDYSDQTITYMFKIIQSADNHDNNIAMVDYDQVRTLISRFYGNTLTSCITRLNFNLNANIFLMPIFSTQNMRTNRTLLVGATDNTDGHWALLAINMMSKTASFIDSLGPENSYMHSNVIQEFAFSFIEKLTLFRHSNLSLAETAPTFVNHPCKSISRYKYMLLTYVF